MGVNDLWQILEPVKQHIHLNSLSGKSIAVDLSLWVCEAQTVKKMIGAVSKPHLRNLFFRISHLTLMDVKLVFVMEGEPPKLKTDVMNKRNQIRYGHSGKTWSQKTGRSHFKSVLREDPHVDCYTMSSIKSQIGLDRDALVGLAILLGCDYLPKGIPGIGKEQALKLIQILKGQSLLQRFTQWSEKSCYSDQQPVATKKPAHCSVCSHPGSPKDHKCNGCKFCPAGQCCEPHGYEHCCPCEWHQAEHDRQLVVLENNIKKKACSCEGFPFHEVIEEFLLNKDKVVKVIKYQRPDLLLFQRFTLEKMEWPNHYACEKLLVLLTHYDMIERKLGRRNSSQLQPVRIVKNRIRNGVHCFEIEWEKPEHYTIEDKNGELTLQTIEEESLFEAAFPEIVAIYQKQKLEITRKKKESIKTKPKENNLPEADDKSFQSLTNLKPTYEISSEQNSQLNLEIFPHSTLPQESVSASLDSLPLSADGLCLNTQEHFISASRPLATQQIKAVSKSLISESSQPNSSSHNELAVADLHLSTIDWEGTSFSNSPVIPRNSCSHGLKSELQTAIPDSFKTIPGQLSCDNVLDRDLRKTKPEEHLLSGITDLCLQDLPLKERILAKSSHPQDNVQPDTDLKTLSLLTVKESCIANSSSVYPSHLSKDLLGIYLPNESRNSEVLKGNQLFQENYKVNTSVPHSIKNMVVKTSDVKAEPSNTSFDHSRTVDLKTTQNIVMRKSVCLERYSSDEESIPGFGKAKYATEKMKQGSRKHKPAQLKKNDADKLIQVEETEQYVQAYKTAGTEEKSFPEAAKGSLSFLQCCKEKDDSDTCLDSPLPLCQRLKLRFQNT
ncbi:flap endonuclease GEN homolog 1 isoform X2 [Phyllostomus hastatus]|uniref:flap endonuclease GEN homolog 1 isoform X2 n=1 Tax=Phyllostomus hastatus TaxID=9423 RepID=UPI001E67F0E6|nr:flap endonuclease GEN homolog 1 isoform X2 [Phyllostomus hastatus]